jgi:PKD repeat protein
MRIFTFLFCLCYFSINAFCQQIPCATSEIHNALIKQNPELVKKKAASSLYSKQYAEGVKNKRQQSNTVYVIPVVFHILHVGGAENISDAQVYDQMRILNEDFRRLNADTNEIVPAFKSLAADCELEFRLAQLDPNGNCTNGIDRIFNERTIEADEDSKVGGWPRGMYLNIWVARSLANGAAGYAYYPWSADGMPELDGIMMLSDYIGSIGSSSITKSRVLTHEIGHYLDLQHVWGSNNSAGEMCGDDEVDDTPITIGYNNYCPKNTATTCDPAILENVQNYMDYAYCDRMFTWGQKWRMRAALESTIAERENLWSTSNLALTGVNSTGALCKADFTASKRMVCKGSSISFSDQSWNNPTGWQWTFPGGNPSTSTAQNPIVQYDSSGVFNVTLTVSNAGGTLTKTYSNFINVIEPAAVYSSAYTEGFEDLNRFMNEWTVVDQDNSKWSVVNTPANGYKSVKLQNDPTKKGQVDEIVSPVFNLAAIGATQRLSFKVAYAQRNGSENDKLQVMFSANCGITWTTRYTRIGSALATVPSQSVDFTPGSASQWRTDMINLSNYATATNVLVKFVFTSYGGNNIYIDDINLESTTGINELSAESIGFNVYPNPANEKAELTFALVNPAKVRIDVIDVLGRQIKIEDKELSKGNFSYTLQLPAAVYTVRVIVDGKSLTKRLIVN